MERVDVHAYNAFALYNDPSAAVAAAPPVVLAPADTALVSAVVVAPILKLF